MTSVNHRKLIDELIRAGKTGEAAQELHALWAREPASAAFVSSRYKEIAPSLSLTQCRIAFERSFTLEPLMPMLEAAALANGVHPTTYLGPFNAYMQEVLEPESALYQFEPEIVVVALLAADVAPELAISGAATAADRWGEQLLQRVTGQYSQIITSLRAHTSAHLIIHLLERPPFTHYGILDAQMAHGEIATIENINASLQALALSHRGVYLLDYDALVSRCGRSNWYDRAKWETVRMPIRAEYHQVLAREWLRFVQPLTGKIAKVAAVDLDNTVWEGVIGEDGLSGIRMGQDHRGAPFRALQQALLNLRDRGILLAICSKNNPTDVHEVFERHPDMLLKKSDFSAIRVNWEDKSANLQSIAAELSVGIDAIALIDDNPVERQQVRSALPSIHVLNLPDQAEKYAEAICQYPAFERLALSSEDRERSRFYEAQRQVSELRVAAPSRDDFYRALHQRAIIEPVTPFSLPRVAQLTQKTNQFNLTTRRYSEQEVSALAKKGAWRTFTLRLIDRYGDNGLVGVAFTRDDGEIREVDTFLLSCRVIGRGAETALLAEVAADARNRGIFQLRGRFLKSLKNQAAERFFENHAFTLVEQSQEGSIWQLDLASQTVDWPPFIEREAPGSKN
jgi:FkbH-like protein